MKLYYVVKLCMAKSAIALRTVRPLVDSTTIIAFMDEQGVSKEFIAIRTDINVSNMPYMNSSAARFCKSLLPTSICKAWTNTMALELEAVETDMSLQHLCFADDTSNICGSPPRRACHTDYQDALDVIEIGCKACVVAVLLHLPLSA